MPWILGFAVIALVLGGVCLWLFIDGLKWKVRYREAVAATPDPTSREARALRRGEDLLLKSERFVWTLRDVESAREAAQEAELKFLMVLEKHPDNGRATIGIARSRALRFDYATACEQYLKGLAQGGPPRARFELGMAYFSRHLFRAMALSAEEFEQDARAGEFAREAEAHLTEFVERSSENARRYVAMLTVAALRGHNDATPPMIQTAHEFDPTIHYAPLLVGWIRLQEGRVEDASEQMIELVSRFENVPEAHAIRARALASMSPPQHRTSRGEWLQVLKLAPRCAEGHLALGRARLALQEPDADDAFDAAVKLDDTLRAYVPRR